LVPKNGISRAARHVLGNLSTMSAGSAATLSTISMTKNRTPDDPVAEAALPARSLEKAEKGSHRSMWELLLQLRVLLPYLVRIVPLLDRGLLKGPPDNTELTKGIAEMQNSSRDLEAQARNQALQLERIEQQIARLRVVQENDLEDSRRLSSEIRSLRSLVFAMAILLVVLLLVCVGLLIFLVVHT
jgi:hypothetical protein